MDNKKNKEEIKVNKDERKTKKGPRSLCKPLRVPYKEGGPIPHSEVQGVSPYEQMT